MKEYWHRYYIEHKEEHSKKSAKRYVLNKEKINKRNMTYQQNNLPKMAEIKNRRRARKRGNANDVITESIMHLILEKQRNKCCYCGKKFTAKNKPTLDHITPLFRGGSHSAENVVYACISCNSKKNVGPVLCPVQPILPLAM